MADTYVQYGYWTPGYSTLDATPSLEMAIQTLEPTALLEFYILDASELGKPDLLYFFPGTNPLGNACVWQGQEYQPYPIQADGFDMSTEGKMPRPKLRVANVSGLMGALALQYGDLVGSKLIRKRTLARYLDAINFPEGNPEADPQQELAIDIWRVNQKTTENSTLVEFELSAVADIQGFKLPARKIQAHYCPWVFRGLECGYSGDELVCKHTLEDCRRLFSFSDTKTARVWVHIPEYLDDDQLRALGWTNGQIAAGGKWVNQTVAYSDHHPLPFGGFPGVIRL